MIRKLHNYWIKDLELKSKNLLAAFLTVVILLSVVVLVFWFQFLIFSNQPTTYGGKVIDKSISVLESQRGSRFSRILIIEENGKRIKVSVTNQEYNNVKVGDEVKNDGSGLVILSDK